MSVKRKTKTEPKLEPWDKIKYMVWVDEAFDGDGDSLCGGYWNQYDSIEDALLYNSHEAEIFEFTPKFLGVYKLEPKKQN